MYWLYGTKGSNLLSELQMGHPNCQDMSCSKTPCTGTSLISKKGRRKEAAGYKKGVSYPLCYLS